MLVASSWVKGAVCCAWAGATAIAAATIVSARVQGFMRVSPKMQVGGDRCVALLSSYFSNVLLKTGDGTELLNSRINAKPQLFDSSDESIGDHPRLENQPGGCKISRSLSSPARQEMSGLTQETDESGTVRVRARRQSLPRMLVAHQQAPASLPGLCTKVNLRGAKRFAFCAVLALRLSV